MMNTTYSVGNNLLVKTNSIIEQNLLLTLEEAILRAQEQLQVFASDSEFGENIELAFGSGASAQELRKAWQAGDFSQLPRIEIRSATEINGARGAFAGANNTIYLSQELIVENSNNVNAVIDVLLEEIGHSVDWQINVSDTLGDEGAIFSALVRGEVLDEAELQLLKAEDDTATIILGGQVIGIEQGLFKGEQFVSSTAEDDEIYGTGKDDKLFGNGGNNYISGGAGNDQLGGSSDNDTLDGDAGNDTLFGFAADILRGGADNDTYIMVLYDGSSDGKIQIEDVEGVADSLKLSSYDEDSSYQLENEVKLSKTLVEGSIGVQQDGTSLIVDINKDGVVNRADDVEIINFYKKNIDEKGLVFYTPGSGYIEKINFSDDPNLSGEPNLSVVINESSDPVTIGENLTYTLTVTNNGSGNATEVVLTQALTNVTFVNATQTPLKNISGLVTFDLDNLAKGQTKTVDVIVTPNQAGEISTTASVGAKEIDSDNSNNTVTETTDVLVDAEPDLAVTISESSDPVKLGENLTYTLTVTNNGVGNATEVALTQTLKNVTLVSTSLPYVKNKDGDLTFDLDNLAKGETKTVDIVVSPNQAGGISNTARVKAKEIDSDNNNNKVTEITSVQDIILDPLQVNGDFKFNQTTKRYEASGTIQIGLKGEPFQLTVVGSMSYDKNTIKAEGIVSSNIGNLTEPLFKGKFEIPVGEASTLSLIETEPLVGEFKLAGLDSTFNGLNFALGKIGLEGTFLLPDELGGSSVQMSVPNTLIISNDGVSAGGGKFSFPNSKFKLKELIGVESTDLAIEYLPTPEDALKLQGKLSLEPFVKSISPTITADFSGDNFIQVDKNGVEVEGALSVENIPIVPNLWELKKAKLTLSTGKEKEIKGEGTILIPLGIEIGGSLGFIYEPDLALNSLSITADNIQRPIPIFPQAFLQRISGKIEHFAKSDPEPLEAGLGIGLTLGPRINNFPLPQWLGGGKGEYALVDVGLDGTLSAEKLTGQGPIKLVHEKLANGQISGELNWNGKEKFFKAEGQFSLLDNLITGKGGFKTNSSYNQINMYLTGNVNVPNFLNNVLRGTQIGSGNGLFHYSNDGSLSNDFIAGWGTIGFQKLGIEFKAITGFKYKFDGSFSPISSFEIESIDQLTKGEGSTLPGLAFNNNSLAHLNAPLENQIFSQTVQQAWQIAQEKLKQFATDIDFSTKLNIAFGNTWNTEKAQVLAQAWAEGSFSTLLPIQIRPSATISGANAAFASATNTIYIASEYLTQNTANLDAVAGVLLEEIGHFVDAKVNVSDAPGDEGAIFSALVSGEILTESQLQQLKAEDDTVTINLNGQDIQLNLNSSKQDTFRISAGKPWLAITASWDNSASNVPIQLQAPDGTIYTEADIANSDKIAILEQLTNSIKKTIVVVNPTPGDWTLKVVDTANLGNVKFAALAGTNAPTIELTLLTQDASNQNVTINYKAFDVDSDAKISFFYDTDGEGFDGILLADNVIEKDGAGSYVWNTKDVPIDNYHIYALAMDENSAPVFAYSPGSVRGGNTNPASGEGGGGNPPFTPPTPIPEPTPTPTLDESNRGDTLIGTNSNDLIVGRQGDDVLIGKLGNDSLFGGLGNDLLYGNQGEDILNGNHGNDTVYGAQGNDIVRGGKNNDLILGNLGDDNLFGNPGDDTLIGGQGNDSLMGGAGNDLFVLDSATGVDAIADFRVGQDRLGLSGGLRFEQLDIAQGTGISSRDTFVRIAANQELLAILSYVPASSLTDAAFTFVGT